MHHRSPRPTKLRRSTARPYTVPPHLLRPRFTGVIDNTDHLTNEIRRGGHPPPHLVVHVRQKPPPTLLLVLISRCFPTPPPATDRLRDHPHQSGGEATTSTATTPQPTGAPVVDHLAPPANSAKLPSHSSIPVPKTSLYRRPGPPPCLPFCASMFNNPIITHDDRTAILAPPELRSALVHNQATSLAPTNSIAHRAPLQSCSYPRRRFSADPRNLPLIATISHFHSGAV